MFVLECALVFAPELVLAFVLEFVLELVLEFALAFILEFVRCMCSALKSPTAKHPDQSQCTQRRVRPQLMLRVDELCRFYA